MSETGSAGTLATTREYMVYGGANPDMTKLDSESESESNQVEEYNASTYKNPITSTGERNDSGKEEETIRPREETIFPNKSCVSNPTKNERRAIKPIMGYDNMWIESSKKENCPTVEKFLALIHEPEKGAMNYSSEETVEFKSSTRKRGNSRDR